ncbi:hypothetical protein FQN50_004974 [Emmonsiellopsis sp. PD_5]|nr:hypothetical protein FQN50_004974 [Emmonsiellopsis sp. PD_5]
MRLAHLHIPHLIPFSHASHLQQILVSRLLAHKKLCDSLSSSTTTTTTPNPELPAPPDPTILTFTPHPIYTTGRRDLPSPSSSPHTSPTSTHHNDDNIPLPTPLEPIRPLLTSSPPLATYAPTLRGGQTTYHGPGQLVAYTILDLRRLRLGPRAHIRLLERSVLDVLDSYGVAGGVLSGEDPGVWVEQQQAKGANGNGDGERDGGDMLLPRKIAAVGVHLRRFVSSYGVGLNVTEEPMWWLRQIVACGLEGREATSLGGCGVDASGGEEVMMREVAGRFVRAFVDRVNGRGNEDGRDSCCRTGEVGGGQRIEEVYSIGEGDVLGVEGVE